MYLAVKKRRLRFEQLYGEKIMMKIDQNRETAGLMNLVVMPFDFLLPIHITLPIRVIVFPLYL